MVLNREERVVVIRPTGAQHTQNATPEFREGTQKGQWEPPRLQIGVRRGRAEAPSPANAEKFILFFFRKGPLLFELLEVGEVSKVCKLPAEWQEHYSLPQTSLLPTTILTFSLRW